MADITAEKKNLPPLSLSETSAFCSQIGMILRAGISSAEGVGIMLEDAKDNSEKKLLSAINETLAETGSLHEALRNIPGEQMLPKLACIFTANRAQQLR